MAIKVLPERTAMNADLRARFEREAKAISSLNHPNIRTLHDVGHHEDLDFLVMECLEGEVLSQRLKRRAIDVEEGLEIASQIADALAAAHGQAGRATRWGRFLYCFPSSQRLTYRRSTKKA